MRRTVDIDNDVLSAAKQLVAEQKVTAGKVISDPARRALLGSSIQEEPEYRNGFRLMPRTGMITTKMVEQWREDDI